MTDADLTTSLLIILCVAGFPAVPQLEGILLRINRSIQSEGAFGNLKADMGFRRYLCRGSKNVLAESILLAMGCNINKLHHKIQHDRIGQHLFGIKKKA